MGYAKLQLFLPMKAAMVTSVDPDPLWTLDDLLSELNSLELQLGTHDHFSSPLKKYERFSEGKETRGSDKPFVMRILEDAEESGSEDGFTNHGLTTGTRFTCDDFYVSDSEGSDDELHKEPTSPFLMEKKSIEDGILFELENKHHLEVKVPNVIDPVIAEFHRTCIYTVPKHPQALDDVVGMLSESFKCIAQHGTNFRSAESSSLGINQCSTDGGPPTLKKIHGSVTDAPRQSDFHQNFDPSNFNSLPSGNYRM